ncbi:hypothetical protein ABK040_012143 [Willaertia magna]
MNFNYQHLILCIQSNQMDRALHYLLDAMKDNNTILSDYESKKESEFIEIYKEWLEKKSKIFKQVWISLFICKFINHCEEKAFDKSLQLFHHFLFPALQNENPKLLQYLLLLTTDYTK